MYQYNSPAPIELPVLRSRFSIIINGLVIAVLLCVGGVLMSALRVALAVVKFVVGFFVVIYIFKLLIWAAHAQSCTIPEPAAAVGYNTLTMSGLQDWMPYNRDHQSSGITENSDGSMTIMNQPSWHYNDQLDTGDKSFGGGGYFEATLAIQNPIAGWCDPRNPGCNGWPSWWAQAVESQAGVEADFVEFMSAGGAYFDSGFHQWSPTGEITNSLAHGVDTKAFIPSGTDLSQPHAYGWLWKPATPTSPGYTKMFFDGKQVGPTHTWNQGNGPFNELDIQHLQLRLGTGSANPMTVYDVEVWQASADNNIGVTAKTGGANNCSPAAYVMPTPQKPDVSTKPSMSIPSDIATGSENPTSGPLAQTDICAPAVKMEGPLADLLRFCASSKIAANSVNAKLCSEAKQTQAVLDQVIGQPEYQPTSSSVNQAAVTSCASVPTQTIDASAPSSISTAPQTTEEPQTFNSSKQHRHKNHRRRPWHQHDDSGD